jgi:hypothetical protein
VYVENKADECSKNGPVQLLSIGAEFLSSRRIYSRVFRHRNTTEKRLVIDLKAVRNVYDEQEISNVGFVRTKFNPADALTKVGKWDALEQITITGVCDLPVEQWIVRAKQHE